jgi:hypothetical protein
MLRQLTLLVLVCLGLSACYLGDSGSQLLEDMQKRAAEDAAKAK